MTRQKVLVRENPVRLDVVRYGMAFDRLRALARPAEKSAEFLVGAADSTK